MPPEAQSLSKDVQRDGEKTETKLDTSDAVVVTVSSRVVGQ